MPILKDKSKSKIKDVNYIEYDNISIISKSTNFSDDNFSEAYEEIRDIILSSQKFVINTNYQPKLRISKDNEVKKSSEHAALKSKQQLSIKKNENITSNQNKLTKTKIKTITTKNDFHFNKLEATHETLKRRKKNVSDMQIPKNCKLFFLFS